MSYPTSGPAPRGPIPFTAEKVPVGAAPSADPERHHSRRPAAAWAPPASAAHSAGLPAGAAAPTGANESAGAGAAREQAASKADDDGPFFMKLGFLGRVVALLVAFQLLAAVAFEWSHQQWSGVDVNEPLPSVPEGQRPSVDGLFTGFRHLAAPYFSDRRNTKGRVCCYTIVALGLLGLFLAYVHNAWHKDWWDLFQKGDSSRFPSLMGIYIVIVVAVVLTRVYVAYVRSWLYIDWREHMTQRLAQRWLVGHTHFLMQVGPQSRQHVQRVDNPDQRLQEDVNLFVSSALDICPNFLNSAGSLFVFVPVVLNNEPESAFGVPGVHFPGWLLAMAVAYSFIGGMCTHLIGWPMITYSFARQRYEADFRNLAIHIRDNSQSVALYNSEATERSGLQRQFDRIKLVQWRQMILEKRLAFFTSAYDYVQFLVPFFILAPSYFKKEISLGDLFQLTGAIGSVANSFDWFMRIYGPLSDWRATADRLLSFERRGSGCSSRAQRAPARASSSRPWPASGRTPRAAACTSPRARPRCSSSRSGPRCPSAAPWRRPSPTRRPRARTGRRPCYRPCATSGWRSWRRTRRCPTKARRRATRKSRRRGTASSRSTPARGPRRSGCARCGRWTSGAPDCPQGSSSGSHSGTRCCGSPGCSFWTRRPAT
ncbi:unnamed protein product [Prorocentrum cordatum]|uniref:ABC transmembrane type-1 domain-containing protein n=1 Tax=Prorocentrum cordatum TaxID=2364126 RepID=A0ABN9TX92_9DINO|nr:unnamed protein product [Polarella glacialis]